MLLARALPVVVPPGVHPSPGRPIALVEGNESVRQPWHLVLLTPAGGKGRVVVDVPRGGVSYRFTGGKGRS